MQAHARVDEAVRLVERIDADLAAARRAERAARTAARDADRAARASGKAAERAEEHARSLSL
jgi:hypothetical protein